VETVIYSFSKTLNARATFYYINRHFFVMSPEISAMKDGFQPLRMALKCLFLTVCFPSFVLSILFWIGLFFKPFSPFIYLIFVLNYLKLFRVQVSVAMKLLIGGKPDFGWGGGN
jgi:hypothetical protein